jgi:hypothetical protein
VPSVLLEEPARRNGRDHGDAEDRADGARIEHAVEPGAEHHERKRGAKHDDERAALDACAVEPEAPGVDDDAGDREHRHERLHADERRERRGEDHAGAEAAHAADDRRADGEQGHRHQRRRVEKQARGAAPGAAARSSRWRRR